MAHIAPEYLPIVFNSHAAFQPLASGVLVLMSNFTENGDIEEQMWLTLGDLWRLCKQGSIAYKRR